MILNAQPALSLHVALASTPEDIAACQVLIRETYLREYGVELTHDPADPDAKRERLPDRYIQGTVDGLLVAAAGLYVGRTYTEEYGDVSMEEVDRALIDAGAWDTVGRTRVELTKAVVREGWARQGIGRVFIGACHSRSFMDVDGTSPALLLCGKVSIFKLWKRLGIRTRLLKEFPPYRSHDRYRASGEPMESRLVIPELDVHPRWYDQVLPVTLAIDVLGGVVAH